MVYTRTILVTLALSALCGGGLGCGAAEEKRAELEEPDAEKGKPKANLPKGIYATFEQEGAQEAEASVQEEFEKIQADSDAINVFLVRGKDIKEAVSATVSVQSRGVGVDAPVTPEGGTRSKSIWAVVYLGNYPSGPPVWQIHSVQQQGNVIRIAVWKPHGDGSTKDLISYFAWIPLGELEAARYTVELFDADAKVISLRRRVIFPAK